MVKIVAYNRGIGLNFDNDHIAYFKTNGCSDEEIASFETNRSHPKLIQGLYDMYGPCIYDWNVPFDIYEYDETRYVARIVHIQNSFGRQVEKIVLEQHISRTKIVDLVCNQDMTGLTAYLEKLDNVVVAD